MFTDFFYYLRSCGLKVSLNEWMSLLEAMRLGLHDSSLTGFYYLARMLLVKSEADFDRFDRAFLEFFRDVQSFDELPKELLDWLSRPIKQREYNKEDVDRRFAGLDLAAIRKMMEQRLREQHERHDGGSKWIGTGGTSPFGNSGYAPTGVRVGGESRHRNAVQVAAERQFRDFRQDTTLDARQFQMAFRRLRQLSSRTEGPKDELQLEETIRETCDNAGHLKLAFDRPRTNQVRLLLLFDSGGSMWPYTQLCGQLFRAVHQSSHFKELRTYYFHNCPYETLSLSANYWSGEHIPTEKVLHDLSSQWKVIFVGDGAMALSELTEQGGSIDYYHYNQEAGITWVRRFVARFPHLVWLNPIPENQWSYIHGRSSIQLLRETVDMYPLSLEGLDAALKRLMVNR